MLASMLISISLTKSLDERLEQLHNAVIGKEKLASSCYSKALHFAKQNYLRMPNMQFALVSKLSDGKPTHMVILDDNGTNIVFDSLADRRVSGPLLGDSVIYKGSNGKNVTSTVVHAAPISTLA